MFGNNINFFSDHNDKASVKFEDYKNLDIIGDYALSGCIFENDDVKNYLKFLNNKSVQTWPAGGFSSERFFNYFEDTPRDLTSPGLRDDETYEITKSWDDLI